MISSVEPNTEFRDIDPIFERKQYIKECLEKNVYDHLVGIIIEYDYDFSGRLYKIIDTNEIIYSISALSNYKIVICGLGNTLKILNIDSNECTSITHKHRGISLAVTSANGNIITIPSCIGTIDVYDRNYNCMMKISEIGFVCCVTCFSDGRIVTASAYDYDYIVCLTIWNPNNGIPDIVIKNDSTIFCIAALTDQLLVSGDFAGNVKIWDSFSGELKRTLTGHTAKVTCVAINPDGLIVSGSGSWDQTVKIWNQDGCCINTLFGHHETIYNVSILPNGMILSQSYSLLKMWNPLKGECILSLKQNNMIYCTVLKNGLVACVVEGSKIYVYY